MELIVAGAIFLLTTIVPPQNNKSADGLISLSPQETPVKSLITPKPPTPTPKQQKVHLVKAGENINTIADKYYGSEAYWKTLWNDNPEIEDPTLIKPGMELNIRTETPNEPEELDEKLAAIFEELTAPTPTPTPKPTKTVAGTETQAAQTGPPSNFDEAYHQAGSRFGVPWEILYGLHHMETGGRDGAITSGYGTGAQGPLQFMPGTWASYGIDGNGDGNADINNAMDAIFGAANFIAAHGGVEQGLRSYGGDSQIVLNYARSRGYNQ